MRVQVFIDGEECVNTRTCSRLSGIAGGTLRNQKCLGRETIPSIKTDSGVFYRTRDIERYLSD